MWNEVVSQPLIPSELSASFQNDSKKKDGLRKGFCIVPCTRVGARGLLVGGGLGGIKRLISSLDDTVDARLTIQPH